MTTVGMLQALPGENQHLPVPAGPHAAVSMESWRWQMSIPQERELPALRKSRHGDVVRWECRTLSHASLQEDSLSPAFAASEAGERTRSKGSRGCEQILHWPCSGLREVFTPTTVLRAKCWGLNASAWFSAWLGWPQDQWEQDPPEHLLWEPCPHGQVSTHQDTVLWLSWCNSTLHYMSIFKLFTVSPLFLFVLSLFRRNLD